MTGAKSFLKRIRADFAFSSFVCIALGVLFIIFSDSVFSWLAIALAVILLAIGIIMIASKILEISTGGFSAVIGSIMLVLGLALLILKDFAAALVPIVVGVVVIAHGLRGLKESATARKCESKSWWVGLITSVLSVIFGVICIVNAFGVLKVASIFFGIVLIFNGVTNLFVAGNASVSERRYNKNHPIDVEFVEDKSEE